MATTRPLSEILPKEMTELRVRPIFTLLLDVAPPINVGKTPGVDRRVGVITGGRFEGERLRGTLLPGGSDWQAIRRATAPGCSTCGSCSRPTTMPSSA